MAGPWDNSSEVITSTPTKGANPWDNTSEVFKPGSTTKEDPSAEVEQELDKYFTNGKFDSTKRLRENSQNAINNAEISARGLPIVGQGIKRMFPESERLQNYREENPVTSEVYKAVGEYAPFMPMAKMVTKGGNLALNSLGAGGITGSVRVLDSLADPDKKNEDIVPDAMMGFAEGATGPLAGKFLSPGITSKLGLPPGRKVHGAPGLGHPGPSNAWDKAVKPLSGAMLAGAGAVAFPPYGIAMGLAPFIPGMAKGTIDLMKKYPGSTWSGKNIKGLGLSTTDILTAMSMGHGSKSTPETE